MKQVDKAIFLSRTPYSETSLITRFYTFSGGIQHFLFQGGKKKSSALFPMSICEITYYGRTDSDLKKLTEARPLIPLNSIQQSVYKSTIAFFCADLVKQSIRDEHEDTSVFQFLEDEIIRLENDSNISSFALSFTLGWIEQLGIAPEADEKIRKYLLIDEGIFSDTPHGFSYHSGREVIQLQEIITQRNFDRYTTTERAAMLDLLLKFLSYHLPNFNTDKSMEIIRAILYE